MTIDIESVLNLESDEGAVATFLAEHDGLLDRDDRLADDGDRSIYWLTMRPRLAPTEHYFVRLQWLAYPYEPPSIKFAIGIRGALNVTSAWPTMNGYRPASFDICRPMCREGYAIHAEWKEGSTAWPIEGNPFHWVVLTMQDHFDNEYQARSA